MWNPFKWRLRSNEYRKLRILIAELDDDVTKLAELWGRIDARQRSGLRKRQEDSAAPAVERSDDSTPALAVVGESQDRSAMRQKLHELAKARGLR